LPNRQSKEQAFRKIKGDKVAGSLCTVYHAGFNGHTYALIETGRFENTRPDAASKTPITGRGNKS